MPVKSSDSSVIKWPNHRDVDRAVRLWAQRVGSNDPNVRRVGYFGSYARGDWGVGSDIDLIVIVDESNEPFERRNLGFRTDELPVQSQLLVYTRAEWDGLLEADGRFGRTLQDETVWVYPSAVP